MNIEVPKLNFFKLFLLGLIAFSPIKEAKSEQIHLTCVGKFEIDRGPLIKPDWQRSYFTMNIEGILRTPSTIISDGGFPKRGRTFLHKGAYHIDHVGQDAEVLTKYIVNLTTGNYLVNYTKEGRVLIGTCRKVEI